MKKRLSINMYPQENGHHMLVLKTDTKTKRIRNLKKGMVFKGELKNVSIALESGALLAGIYSVEDEAGKIWRLGFDAQTLPARLGLDGTDFMWQGPVEVLKRALRFL